MMKKLILTMVLVSLAATPVFALPTFEFDKADLLNFSQLSGFSDGFSNLMLTTTTSYGDGATLTGEVGYAGVIFGNTSTTGFVGLGLTGSHDLSGFDAFSMSINNDNDDVWNYRLFAETSLGIGIYSAMVPINGMVAGPPNSSILTLDISGLAGRNDVTAIGLEISANRPDFYHTSVTLPAPGAILLGSIGITFVGWLRRRRTL